MEKQILYVLKNTDPLLKVTMFANPCKGTDKVVKLWTQPALLSNFRLVQQIFDPRLEDIFFIHFWLFTIYLNKRGWPLNHRFRYKLPPLKDRNKKL